LTSVTSTTLITLPVLKKAVGLVKQQHSLFLLRLPEHPGEIPLGQTQPWRNNVRCSTKEQRPVKLGGNMLAVSGFSGPGGSVETNASLPVC
jgi:hypothetical protein